MAYNTQLTTQQKIAKNIATLESTLSGVSIKQKFNEVLNKNAGAFVASLLSLVKNNDKLAECDPKTILSATMTAATLKLPINPNLGFAYIVPYKSKTNGMEATFQIGYKGIIQLAMRTGQYKTINASVVHEGEIEDVDFITGEIIRGKRTSNKVIGYIAYFKLINGFEKTLYMTVEEMQEHANKFSQAYGADKRFGNKKSVWTTNFDAMALKTVLKQLISKYGIMSIDMQGGEAMATAIQSDQAVIREDGSMDYVDNPRTKDITPPEQQPTQPVVDEADSEQKITYVDLVEQAKADFSEFNAEEPDF